MTSPRAALLLIFASSLLSLTACAVSPAEEEEVGAAQQAEKGRNGLTSNGLMNNGLTNNGLINNGLTNNGLINNGLTSGGIASVSDLQSELDANPDAQMFLSYVVSCALPAGASVVIPSLAQPGTSYTFAGGLGVAPDWGSADTSACDTTCQEWVSACVISRVNYLGEHVPLSLRGDNPGLALEEGELEAYPDREATYFGNVFTSPQQLYGCQTTGDDLTLIGRPCGHGADTTGCVIDVIQDCGTVCIVDAATGYYGTCTAGGSTYTPAVTVFREPS
jgi:hypothetical protein